MPYDVGKSHQITDTTRKQILHDFGYIADDLLATGTEAEVYANSDDVVLKIYADVSRFQLIKAVQSLYYITVFPDFDVPVINKIQIYDDAIAVIEDRIKGRSLEMLLAENMITDEQAQTILIDTLTSLQKTMYWKLPLTNTRLLKDWNAWHSFKFEPTFEIVYADMLTEKIEYLNNKLTDVLDDFESISQKLIVAIKYYHDDYKPYMPPIHGDLFEGNIMVDTDTMQLSGVIDFGTFTMFGDNLFDWSTAFGYYRMYHPERELIRERLLERMMKHLPESRHPQFFRYLLANAIMTCDLYARGDDLEADGHFQWALELLENKHYWEQAEILV